MKDTVFSEAMDYLEAIFRVPPLSQASLKAYWGLLQDIPDNKFKAEVELIVRTENFFPSAARLLKAKRQGEVAL